MLRDVIDKILTGWVAAKDQSFTNHPIGNAVRHELVESVSNTIQLDYPSYKLKGSPGSGNWANVPWLSILNPTITDTTQDGVYPVYLFQADAKGVYLSLVQGTTTPQQRIGKAKAKIRAEKIANAIRQSLPELARWGMDIINLNSTTTLGRSYEYGNIIAKYYPADTLPSDQEMTEDLLQLMDFYKQIESIWTDISKYEEEPTPATPINSAHPHSNTPLPKPFLLLAGISGTGKTRFVREQAKKHHQDLSNYCLIPVRPDWHEPSDLLGYITRLGQSGPQYITTDLLRFIVKAWQNAIDSADSNNLFCKPAERMTPYWLCLDEMNLAPVEQYFADYLSVLETREWTGASYQSDPLLKATVFNQLNPEGKKELCTTLGLDSKYGSLWSYFCTKGIPLPPNLIIAGTVNMDETTHGFSRKVIDRAFTIDFGEFYPNDYQQYFTPGSQPKTLSFPVSSAVTLAELNAVQSDPSGTRSINFLENVNSILKQSPFELAYRALNELLLSLVCFAPENDITLQAVWDDFLMTKVLPRIEGDADKLFDNGEINLLTRLQDVLEEQLGDIWDDSRPDLLRESVNANEPLGVPCRSQKKLIWMNQRLKTNGFTAYWP